MALVVIDHASRARVFGAALPPVRTVACAFLGVALNQSLFLWGLSFTSAHVAAILVTTIPVLTLLIAMAAGRERGSLLKFAGIAMAAAGAILVILTEMKAGDRRSVIGAVLILMNCVAYSSYLVISKPLVERWRPLSVIARLFVIAAFVMAPVALPEVVRIDWSALPRDAWMALAAVVAGPTVAAYALNGWALGRAESSLVAVYNYLQPLFATLLAYLVLREDIRPAALLAGLLIILGVALTSRGSPMAVNVSAGRDVK